jgi:hypothetical protein
MSWSCMAGAKPQAELVISCEHPYLLLPLAIGILIPVH